MSRRLLILGLALAASSIAGCGEEEDLPPADVVVKIEEERFFEKEVSILPGDSVLWVNMLLPRSPANVRTVTAGTPEAPHPEIFDATLQGHGSDERYGEYFLYVFEEAGEYPYFSTRPGAAPFTGKVIVH
jgi:plastocyanin